MIDTTPPRDSRSHARNPGPSATCDRYARGLRMLELVDGDAGLAVASGLAQLFPALGRHLVGCFGDVYSRPGLGLREREIAVVAALTALGNAAPQLRVHVEAALHVGCRPGEILETVMQTSLYAGFPAALNALAVVKDVFASHAIAFPLAEEGDVSPAG